MRAVVQRVKRATVHLQGVPHTSIGQGLVLLLGIATEDSQADGRWLAEKVAHLRIFADQDEKMNLSLLDIGGELLIVSQFTLLGDCRKGRRPGFSAAAPPEKAKPLYEHFIGEVEGLGVPCATGVFQAEMEIELVNDGPVTLVLETP